MVTNSAGLHVGPASFLAAMFMSLFVIYGFDTASTLAEETRDPRRAAPKAVLYAVIGAFIIGGVFLLGTLIAIPNLHAAITGNGGLGWNPANVIEANFPSWLATIYLLVVSAAIFVCCLSILAATIRLCFGMSRDNTLPFSRTWSKVSPTLHTPVFACIIIALLAAVPFLKYSGAGIIAIAATGLIYFSYFLGNLVVMRARARGWPKVSAPFKLGRWGILVNVLALLYGGAMIINFAWPRAASNPKPNQTGGLLSFGMSWLDGIPILWAVFAFIVVIGVIYYLAVGRRKEFAPVVAPEGDDAPLVPGTALPSRLTHGRTAAPAAGAARADGPGPAGDRP